MNEPLRVAVDVSAIPERPAGAGRYVVELVGALVRRSDVALNLLCRRDDVARWRDVAQGTPSRAFGVAPAHRAARLVFGEIGLGELARRVGQKPSVFFGPHYTFPIRVGVPFAVTVHDLTMLEHPEWHERSKVVVFSRAMQRAARSAQGIVFVSDFTRRRFENHFSTSAQTFVIPHGVDTQHFSPAPRADDEAVLSRLGVQPPYVLAVGTIEPRKNLTTLVDAFARVARSKRDFSLVIAGGRGWGVDEVERAIERSHVGERVEMLGYVADDDLPALYRGAQVSCYASLEEGFGVPALESLSCGTALVTTGASAMHEFAGEAAIVVDDPRDPAALAGAIEVALSPDAARRARGIEIAAGMTWDRCAAAHAEAFGRLAAR